MPWIELTSAPGSNEPALVTDGTSLYALGGQTGGTRSARIDRYDIANDTWDADGTMGDVHGDLPAGFYLAGPNRAYCAGGSNAPGETAYARVDAKDITPDTVVNVGALGTARSLVVGAASGGSGYVFGGRNVDGSDVLATAEKYTHATNSWAAVTAMPGGKRASIGRGSLTDSIGRVHLIGGTSSPTSSNRLDRHERYDPTSDTYSTLAVLPAARLDGGVASLGAFVYWIGGNGALIGGGGSFTSHSEVFRYDVGADTWTLLPATENMPVAGLASAVAVGQYIYVLRGTRLFRFEPPTASSLGSGWTVGEVRYTAAPGGRP